eukprot:JP446422.1.p1 GENE.JP446422.1~~JP446422.1.p1  ORF type:complete len:326 (-),score=160.15 JP446422.1:136-1053(-)
MLAAAMALPVFQSDEATFFSNERVYMVDAINNDRTSTWEATADNIFANASMATIKGLMGTIIEDYDTTGEEFAEYDVTVNSLPKSFDPRVQWPNYIGAIRNQEKCGSCWAFGATEAFADRLAIKTNGKVNVVLSPEDLVSCAPFPDMGCNGGIPRFAWGYMKSNGVVADSCFPYTAGDGNAPKCAKTCSNGAPFTKHKISKWFHATGEANIMKELMENGPMEAAFTVYEDFMSYKSGVYVHKTGNQLGGHAIKILGWGEENGVKYWLCANSWTTKWGENGTFKILRGSDHCGIETTVYGGYPAEN